MYTYSKVIFYTLEFMVKAEYFMQNAFCSPIWNDDMTLKKSNVSILLSLTLNDYVGIIIISYTFCVYIIKRTAQHNDKELSLREHRHKVL